MAAPSPDFQLKHPLPYGLDQTSKEADFWPTPAHCVESLLQVCPPFQSQVITDPCAGDGAIIRVLQEYGYDCMAVEIREEMREELSWLCPTEIGDFLTMSIGVVARTAIITNPPFSIAVKFAYRCLRFGCEYVALLLRCNVIGSNTWAQFWCDYPPSAIYPLKKRPSFSGDGKTDASEYAWFVWIEGWHKMLLRPI